MMKRFWVEFRDESISENLLGAYIEARSWLQVELFWTHGKLVHVHEVRKIEFARIAEKG